MGNCGRDQPEIFHVVSASALSGLAYTAVILAAAQRPESLLGSCVRTWVAFTGRLVEVVLFLAPPPNASTDSALLEKIAAYRHLLVACSLIAIWAVFSSRPYWPRWAERLREKLGGTSGHRRPAKLVLVASYRTTILGIVAVALLMLFGEPRSGGATTFLYATDLTLLRAPLFAAVACGLGCRAGALWYWLRHD